MPAFYSFCLIFSLALCQHPNQRHKPPFKIAISAVSPIVVTESEVYIKVSLTNTSDHDVNEGVAYVRDLDSTFRFEVREEHGKLVPKRTYPHPELGTPGSVTFRTIARGETLTQEQRVSALYDMRKPGKYKIQVWKRNPDYDMKSNVITITVIPNDKGSVPKADKAP